MPTRILIVDDHAMIRSALKVFLSLDADLQIVGDVGDGAEALRCIDELRPDLVLMDLAMPGMGGVETTREIKQRYPEIEVLILSSGTRDSDLVDALAAGARGYVLKDANASQLVRTLKAALVSRVPSAPPVRPKQHQEAITEREMDVMRLVAEGLSNQQIGERLQIGERTVKAHVSRLLSKLGARSRSQIAVHSWKVQQEAPDDAGAFQDRR